MEKAKRLAGYRCFECNSPAQQAHHIVPASRGGTRTIPLCESCHEKAHDRSVTFKDHGARVKKGIDLARKKGVKIGRPRRRVNSKKLKEVLDKGLTITEIAEGFGVHRSTIYRLIRSSNQSES